MASGPRRGGGRGQGGVGILWPQQDHGGGGEQGGQGQDHLHPRPGWQHRRSRGRGGEDRGPIWARRRGRGQGDGQGLSGERGLEIAEGRRQGPGVLWPVIGIEGEAAIDELGQGGGHLWGHVAQRDHAAIEEHGEDLALGVAGVGPAAAQALIEHGAQGEDVGAGVHRLALELLRGHVLEGAHHAARGGLHQPLLHLHQAEVQQLHEGRIVASADQHHVVRLEIAVDQPHVVGQRQRPGEDQADLHRLADGHGPFGEPIGEGDPVEQLHDEVGLAALRGVAHVEDPDHMMRVLPEGLCGLGLLDHAIGEALGHLGRDLLWQGEDLDGSADLEAGVLGDVHRAHAPSAEGVEQPVASSIEPLRGLEAVAAGGAESGAGIRHRCPAAGALIGGAGGGEGLRPAGPAASGPRADAGEAPWGGDVIHDIAGEIVGGDPRPGGGLTAEAPEHVVHKPGGALGSHRGRGDAGAAGGEDPGGPGHIL